MTVAVASREQVSREVAATRAEAAEETEKAAAAEDKPFSTPAGAKGNLADEAFFV